jgi:hypothetical protein
MQALEMKMGYFIRFAKQTLFVYGLWFEEGERREEDGEETRIDFGCS